MLGAETDAVFARAPRDAIARFVDMVIYMEYDEITRVRCNDDAQQAIGAKDGEWILRMALLSTQF
jgi:hypothetical protein